MNQPTKVDAEPNKTEARKNNFDRRCEWWGYMSTRARAHFTFNRDDSVVIFCFILCTVDAESSRFFPRLLYYNNIRFIIIQSRKVRL